MTRAQQIARRARLRARILRNIAIDPITGCWRWTGRKNNGGYPILTERVEGYKHPRPLFAHRVSLEVFKGAPTCGQEAAHDPERCPHTDCVNWHHLRWATRKENEADKRHPRRLAIREVSPPVHILGVGHAESSPPPAFAVLDASNDETAEEAAIAAIPF